MCLFQTFLNMKSWNFRKNYLKENVFEQNLKGRKVAVLERLDTAF